MRKITMKGILICLVLFMFIHCREKYVLHGTSPSTGYLVVEGFINSGEGPTNIRLSRTVGLTDTSNIKRELAARILVQGNDNSSQLLTETGDGSYSAGQLSINDNLKYRLYIKTADGKEYTSDYAPVRHTPAIDTISWERTERGVELFANTHAAQTGAKYYRWEYEETWEFHSAYYSNLRYIYNSRGEAVSVEDRPSEEAVKMFYCWHMENSSNILIGTSAGLSADSIHLLIQTIPSASWKLGVLYTIKVRQYSISAEEHEFLRRMKKNTEQVGSLFDAQPSELKGNIHCTANPDEIVVGFVGITDSKEQRIFISNSDVPNWGYMQFCALIKVKNVPDSLQAFQTYIPVNTQEINMMGKITYINVSENTCVDCTTKGTNIKPSFWP